MTIKYLDSKRISVLSSSCLVRFTLDESSGNPTNHATTANGFPLGTGSTNDGTNGSSGATQNVTGKFDKCFEFDSGNNKQVNIGTVLSGTGDFSISLWINLTSNNTGYPSVVSNYGGSNTGGYQFLLWGANTISFHTTGSVIHGATVMTTSAWHHVVATRTSGVLDLYVDGSSDATSVANTHSITTSLSDAIGGKSDGTSGFNGKIDEVTFHNKGLTSSEVSALWYSGTGKVTEGSRPPNVQDNSILVEKDTANRYWRTPEASGADVNTTQTSEQDNSGIDGDPNGGGWGVQFTAGHALVGQEVRSIKVKTKFSNSSGNSVSMTARVYGSTKATLRATSTAISSSTLSQSYQDVTFVFPAGSRATLQAGDHIMIVTETAIMSSGAWFTPIKSSAGTNTHFTTWQGMDVNFYEQDASVAGGRELYYNPIVSGTITPATWTLESPVTLPSGLTIWYDFSDVSTITKDSSDRISVVADKTSNGFDLVQATGGAQPLWVASDKNSLDVIDFAGSRYMASTFASMSNATGYSIVMACVVPADNNTSMFSSTSPASAKLRTYNTGTLALENSGSAITSPAISGLNGSWRTIVCIGNGSSSKVYIDGIDRTSGTVNFSENLVNWLVGAESTGGGYSNAKQGELIAYNRVLSATEISDLHTYLKKKWGL